MCVCVTTEDFRVLKGHRIYFLVCAREHFTHKSVVAFAHTRGHESAREREVNSSKTRVMTARAKPPTRNAEIINLYTRRLRISLALEQIYYGNSLLYAGARGRRRRI